MESAMKKFPGELEWPRLYFIVWAMCC